MNPTGKKLISLFLVFSLMMLSTNLYAKKRGVRLIVTKKNGRQIEGELITVKEDSLLILTKRLPRDESVGIEEIKTIRVGRSRAATALFTGGLVSGVVIGGYIGGRIGVRTSVKAGEDDPEFGGLAAFYLGIILVPLFACIGAAICAAIGALPGLLTGVRAKFQIEGMSESEIQETLDYLRKRARIREYK